MTNLKQLLITRLVIALIVTTIFPRAVWGNYYDTLPKGRRLVAIHQVAVRGVDSYYNGQGSIGEYGRPEMELNAATFENVEELSDYYFDQLKSSYPDLYSSFSAGRWSLSANTDVDVTAVAFAYGLSDRLTIYTTVPYYRATVNLQVEQLNRGNALAVDRAVKEDSAKISGVMLDSDLFLDFNLESFQSLLVNHYGYRPLGSWRAEGIGDVEVTALYRMTDWSDGGMATSWGVSIPTGREDDSSLLQDIAFGSGHPSAFGEFGGGSIVNHWINIDSFVRYTHHFSHHATLRMVESGDTLLTAEQESLEIKPGAQIDYSLLAGFQLGDWVKISPEYLYRHYLASEYLSSNEQVNLYHQQESEISSHSVKLSLELSSINAFMQRKFIMPFTTMFSAQQVVAGKNTPRYLRLDLDFRIMF
ncbi:MAG: hypothetical protein HN353_04860 [Bdellovibrionales bacterium]|nr:hypothetical protein [Bdellovibrionales bacterium]MBT3527383.1 hypothetical protein [Bdellovibrionales bacterium]MBT7766365.1 hypothetical protein [Bdellovibrionales bacterium]